LSNKQKKALTN